MKLIFPLKLLLILFFFQSPLIYAEQQLPVFNLGNDYREVDNKALESISDISQLQQIADIELFYWYGCGACQQVEKALQSYLEQNPGLVYRRTPLVAHISWREQAYLQPMINQLQSKMNVPSVDELYQACVDNCDVFKDYESAKTWLLGRAQLTQLPEIDESAVWQAEKSYRKRAESFSISQVPTIIIREAYAVDANSAKSVARMIEIIDFLLYQVTPE